MSQVKTFDQEANWTAVDCDLDPDNDGELPDFYVLLKNDPSCDKNEIVKPFYSVVGLPLCFKETLTFKVGSDLEPLYENSTLWC